MSQLASLLKAATSMGTVCRSLHHYCELRHRALIPKNQQSHPSRNVLVDHPKQLTFSWTTAKKEESSRLSNPLPNYDWVCTYACIFSNKPRRKSPRIVFLRHYSRPPLSRHTYIWIKLTTQFFFFLVASLLQALCYHQVNDRSARSGDIPSCFWKYEMLMCRSSPAQSRAWFWVIFYMRVLWDGAVVLWCVGWSVSQVKTKLFHAILLLVSE